jgi:hypothetical protein
MEVTGRTKPVLIQFIRVAQRIITLPDPGSVPVETADLGHAQSSYRLICDFNIGSSLYFCAFGYVG